jgi:hypothetical protein
MKQTKQKREPKLTDAERHKRFVDMAHEVEASEDPKDFDRAFNKVVTPKTPHRRQKGTKTTMDQNDR